LKDASPEGSRDAKLLLKLLDMKSEAHYGLPGVSATKARSAVRWARELVERATTELER
jgi:hypothetical protein